MSAICDDSTDPSGRPLTPPRNRELDTRTGGDNLPGQRRRIGDPGSPHDRDWWLKKPIERERITGVSSTVSRFTRRVIEARRQLRGDRPW